MTYLPSPDPELVRPRKLWYWVGSLVIVLGIVGGLGGFVLGVVGAVGSTSMNTEFHSGQTATFQVEEANTDSHSWKLYASESLSSLDLDDCEFTGPGGQDVEMSAPGYSSEITRDGRTWFLAADLDVSEPGEYTLSCTEGTADRFNVGYGPGFADSALGIVGSLAMLFVFPLLGLLVGIITIVVTAVRRANHWRRLRAASSGGYGPGQFGSGGYQGPPGTV